jgi:cell division protein FtsW
MISAFPMVSMDFAKYINDENSQVTHAFIAVANSNVIGLGPGNSIERDFLSHAESDFIYSIIIEEMGFAGGVFVLFLYFALLIRVGRIAQKCRRFFPAYLVLGFGIMMVLQAFVNMGVAVGLFPVTGQPLPLISRGGTSILITSFYIGVILSVSRYAEKISEENVLATEAKATEDATEYYDDKNID